MPGAVGEQLQHRSHQRQHQRERRLWPLYGERSILLTSNENELSMHVLRFNVMHSMTLNLKLSVMCRAM